MKFVDSTQNIRLRLGVIQGVALALLALLGARLYFLQINKGAYYAEKAENQRIRTLPITAPRGVIFDRNGQILVDSRPTYNILLQREELKAVKLDDLIAPLASGLGIEPEILREQFDGMKAMPAYGSLRVKENATPADIAWVEAHAYEYPAMRVELQPQRRYPNNGFMSHVLGYVGEVSPQQLKNEDFQRRNLRPGDIIGKSGLEATYDEFLRGRDGFREVIVDSRGRIQETIREVPPQPGQDLVTTIDAELQLTAEEQLAQSPHKKGVMIAIDPRNGEILTMASLPNYDPNLFIRANTDKDARKEIAALWNHPDKPMYNRAIQGRYPSGSTWKIPMSIAALQQGTITLEHSNMTCGGGITVGNKFTRCMGSHGAPPLDYAITRSCDGYYYHLGLKMGIDGIMQMVDEFELNKRTGVDLPNEVVSQTPNYWKPRIEARGDQWRDIRTVYASIGQDTVAVTPIALLRAIAPVGVSGKMFVPHLAKEFRAVPAVAVGGEEVFPARAAHGFDRPDPKQLPIPEAQRKLVLKGMWGVVNGGGTAGAIKMPNLEIAGKTGTAQVASLGKDSGKLEDHSWFVSFAPYDNPQLAVVTLVENAGFGGRFAAPYSRALYETYLGERERRGSTPFTQLATDESAVAGSSATPAPKQTRAKTKARR